MADYSSKAHFGDYGVFNYGWSSRDPMHNPRLLTALTHKGVYFGLCHIDFAPQLKAFLDELYPHVQGGWHAGSCGIYNPNSTLPDGTRSMHTLAKAVDINWNVNHLGQNIPDAKGKYAMPRAEATRIARKYGMEWGGNWSGGYHDNMHFETHLSPTDARKVKPIARIVAAIKRRLQPGAGFPYSVASRDYIGPLASASKHARGGLSQLERDYVWLVQRRLRYLGDMTTAQMERDGEGTYGAQTTAAVKRWQKRNHYRESGIVSRVVFTKMMSAKAKKK